MTDILASLAKPDAIAALLIALAVFGTVISVLLPYLQTDKLETRLKAVTDQREKLRKQSRAALDNPKGLRRKDDSVVGNISSKLNLAKALEDPNIVNNLAKAGLRGPGPLSRPISIFPMWPRSVSNPSCGHFRMRSTCC